MIKRKATAPTAMPPVMALKFLLEDELWDDPDGVDEITRDVDELLALVVGATEVVSGAVVGLEAELVVVGPESG